jgi:pyruvate ferredoxin oxidoreductase beta subunit
VARLAQQTGLYPIFEIENGQLTSVMKIGVVKPVNEYLKLQGRYRHLLQKEGGSDEVTRIQTIADANIKRFGLV